MKQISILLVAVLLNSCSAPLIAPTSSPTPLSTGENSAKTAAPATTSAPVTATSAPKAAATTIPTPTLSINPVDYSAPNYARQTQFVPLDLPKFISIAQANYLKATDRVLSNTVNGESRAYPVNMMQYHHIANDVIGGKPMLITF